ncbi:hypothetical protein [Micromonospora chalcea]|uniref:hypothetical protein n=1 Tax=Micromonospora chalcea TaxID=1874 RepID=UPI003D728586
MIDGTDGNFAPPLGLDIPASDYNPRRDLIGEAVPTSAGNLSLRIGRETGSGGWEQVAYPTLTPADRERLIATLMAHRKLAPADGGVAQAFTAEEVETLITAGTDAILHGDISEGTVDAAGVELAQRAYARACELYR